MITPAKHWRNIEERRSGGEDERGRDGPGSGKEEGAMSRLYFAIAAVGLIAAGGLAAACASSAEAGTIEEADPAAGGDAPSAAQDPPSAGAKRAAGALNVEVMRVARDALVEEIAANGTTAPVRDVLYSAETAGRIERLPVEVGDHVRKGQVLARVDTRTLAAQVEEAESRHELAETTYERLAALRDDELVSAQQIDEARSNRVGAEARLAIARANLAKSVVRASRPGVVTERHADRAEYVAPGAPLVRVVDLSTIRVEARLAESQVAHIRPGAPATVRVDALGIEREGRVEALVPTADPASKTFALRVELDNADLEVLAGMSARVRVPGRTFEDVVVVPQSAVVEGRERRVFVVEGDRAVERPVRLGPSTGDSVAVLEGLDTGERLVVRGQRVLVDGQRVRVVE